MNSPYRTRSGRILTEEDLDALAAEAERGYDVEELARRARPPGEEIPEPQDDRRTNR
jgi:hypothetical protein